MLRQHGVEGDVFWYQVNILPLAMIAETREKRAAEEDAEAARIKRQLKVRKMMIRLKKV